MIKIEAEDDDAPEFVKAVNAVASGIFARHAPPALALVKVDNWFGPKWLRFSGKLLGAAGVWKRRLTVPPFVPNRVCWERRFLTRGCDDPIVVPQIHISTTSEAALTRWVADVAPGAALVWFSGGSSRNCRGSMMAYVPSADSYWPWYAGWTGCGGWSPLELKEISATELPRLSDLG